MGLRKLATALTFGLAAFVAVAPLASAAPTKEVVVQEDITRQEEGTTPTKDWVVYTRAGTPDTAATFQDGPETPPLGAGSLVLSTATGNEKVFIFNYDHVNTKLTDIDNISYSTYRSTGSDQQVAALNLVIDYDGPDVAGGFSTLVFEPVYNTDQDPVASGEWQDWTATGSGIWWSTRSINGQCAGATSACDKTWDEIIANNPDAIILGGVGINQGSGNPGLVTAVDAFTFDDAIYDFDTKKEKAENKDDCKNGGYENFQIEYKNQGDCVSAVASKGKANGNPEKEDESIVTSFLRAVGLR